MSEELREVYKEGIGAEEEMSEAEEPEAAMSEDAYEEGSEVLASEVSDEEYTTELPVFVPFAEESDEDYEKRIRRRKAKIARKKIRRKLLLIVLIIALFSSLVTMCGRDIIRLKAENRALQKKQKELEAERDKLQKEVENAGQKEYVQDQARKQLRLLNPGELLFTFGDEAEERKEKTEEEK